MEDNTREKLILIAAQLFAEQGYDGTSVRQICKLADVNVSMISYYFGGKKELYQGIINSVMQKQHDHLYSVVNPTIGLDKLSRSEKIELLKLLLEKFMDFLYSDKLPPYLMILFLKEQMEPKGNIDSPAHNFIKKLLGSILQKDENSREVLLTIASIMGAINLPRLVPQFTLKLLGQKIFNKKDILFIKNNAFAFVDCILRAEA